MRYLFFYCPVVAVISQNREFNIDLIPQSLNRELIIKNENIASFGCATVCRLNIVMLLSMSSR